MFFLISLCAMLGSGKVDSMYGIDFRHDDGVRCSIVSIKMLSDENGMTCHCEVTISNRMASGIEIAVPDLVAGVHTNIRFSRVGSSEIYGLGAGTSGYLVRDPEVIAIAEKGQQSILLKLFVPPKNAYFVRIDNKKRASTDELRELPGKSIYAVDVSFVTRFKNISKDVKGEAAVGSEKKYWLSRE